ncbi:hypothetical protein [Streptomyces showdoensis]|uniref:Uncharacterized protein n=1 Tax=Streptomyces showdoensis TaxID=68268 RepID=A0A2P2GQ75_STREW|nr:hypothetical protein [Streptomyces showdoensis]KKZ73643.1 hypothetical protein VO63_12230 [Streptomyces showdoensis]
MTLDRHLAALDLLRDRPFGDRAHHLAELAIGDTPGGAVDAEGADAERTALAGLLAARWGPPDRLGLGSLLLRAERGERMAEPWGLLSTSVPDVELWRAEGRWIALGLVGAAEDAYRLLVCVTEVDPP